MNPTLDYFICVQCGKHNRLEVHTYALDGYRKEIGEIQICNSCKKKHPLDALKFTCLIQNKIKNYQKFNEFEDDTNNKKLCRTATTSTVKRKV